MERGNHMRTIEDVNYDMNLYIRKIRDYIEKFKSLPPEEARILAMKNLIESGIIDESGNLTERYK